MTFLYIVTVYVIALPIAALAFGSVVDLRKRPVRSPSSSDIQLQRTVL
jgi:heme/copper-type cytochrome/quinol oxidase subunit 2